MSVIGEFISIEEFFEIKIHKYDQENNVVLEKIFIITKEPTKEDIECIMKSVHDNNPEFKDYMIMDCCIKYKYRAQFKIF